MIDLTVVLSKGESSEIELNCSLATTSDSWSPFFLRHSHQDRSRQRTSHLKVQNWSYPSRDSGQLLSASLLIDQSRNGSESHHQTYCDPFRRIHSPLGHQRNKRFDAFPVRFNSFRCSSLRSILPSESLLARSTHRLCLWSCQST